MITGEKSRINATKDRETEREKQKAGETEEGEMGSWEAQKRLHVRDGNGVGI